MSRLLCRVGLHRWRRVRTSDGQPYARCVRCGKDTGVEGVDAALRAGWWT